MPDSINAVSPNYSVVGFFAAGTVILAFLGWRFIAAPVPIFRQFGMGLACFSVSFAIWTTIVWIHPSNLDLWNTVGVAAFMPGYFFFLSVVAHNWSSGNRRLILGIAGVYLVTLFALRTFIQPSEPGFSENGLFYFNAQPAPLLLYIVSFAGTLTPAVYAVSQTFTVRWLGRVTLVSFNIIIMCGIVLLSSYDDELQIYNGYLMGIGFLALFAAFLRQKPT